MLQLDSSLIDALHGCGFEVAVESNGTLPAPAGIDWLCVSPKAGTEIVQRSGNELKLVWPQRGIDPAQLQGWNFDHFLIQPMDCSDREAALQSSIAFVMENPAWSLSLQTHKVVGLP
jgi:organic radical activating enzyme